MSFIATGTYTAPAGAQALVQGGNGEYYYTNYPSGFLIESTGKFYGGAGGLGGQFGGDGGIGLEVRLAGTSLDNIGKIEGGNGGGTYVPRNDYTLYIGGDGGTGVFLESGTSLLNQAIILGGQGGAPIAVVSDSYGVGGNGGAGVYAVAGESVGNFYGGVITGGQGGAGGSGGYDRPGTYQAGSGGAGVILGAYGEVDNVHASITGGAGGALNNYATGAAGNGGDGIDSSNSIVVNGAYGAISGGAGGNIAETTVSGSTGFGGVGVSMTGGDLINASSIYGGAGGSGVYGTPGAGGDGVDAQSGVLVTNRGFIQGGQGGNGLFFVGNGGAGGIGVNLQSGALLTNDLVVIGGAGGYGGYGFTAGGAGGTGGSGVWIGASSVTNNNSGTIQGGAGGAAQFAGETSGNGGAGVYLDGGTLTTSGTIEGGAAGTTVTTKGSAGDAIQFGAAASTLIVDSGAVFDGNVAANLAVNDVLEFGGTIAGTATGIGTQFTGFTTVEIATGAAWTFKGTESLLAGTNLDVLGHFIDAGKFTDKGVTTISGTAGRIGFGATGTVMSFASVVLAGGTLSDSVTGKLVVGSTTTVGVADEILVTGVGNAITGFGTVSGAVIVDNGKITASGGVLTLADATSGTGTITIDLGAKLLAKAGLSVAKVAFELGTGSENLTLDNPAATSSLFSGFHAGDVIDLAGLTVTTMTYAAGVLTLLDGAATVDTLKFSGTYTISNFTHTAYAGGTAIGYHS